MADKKWHYASALLERIRDSEYESEKIVLAAEKDDQKYAAQDEQFLFSFNSVSNHSFRFPIHTLVLTAASKYFAASLSSNFKEGQIAEFVLTDTDSQMVKAIGNYCYSGDIDLTPQNVGNFLAIASSFEFDLLEKDCREFLENNLTVASCVNTFILADKYEHTDLRLRAVGKICDSFGVVPAEDIRKLDFRLMAEILKSDSIKSSEESNFNQLLEWVQHDRANRITNMTELLGMIRLEFIPKSFLNEVLEATYKEFDCSDLILAEYRRRVSAQFEQPDMIRSRTQLFFCISQQNEAGTSVLKVEKLNSEEVIDVGIVNCYGCGLVLHGNKLYVMGGQTSSGQYLKTVLCFDLETGAQEVLSEMHSARSYFSPIAQGKYIYAFGGWNGVQTESCERFDTDTEIWEPIEKMGFGRSVSSVVSMDECFCVAGGFHKGARTAIVELYNPVEDKWRQLASMNQTRIRCSLFDWNGTLYVIGGDPVIEKYNNWNDRWTEIGSFEDAARITNVINIGCKLVAVKDDGEVGWVTIGENDAFSFTSICRSKYSVEQCERHSLYAPEE